MKLDRILPFARLLLEKAVKPGDIAIDCTMGNGHDTVFLANLTGPDGHVYSFDIQESALQKTEERLMTNELQERVTLIHAGHERLQEFIPTGKSVTGAIFNLGYLPGGDKEIITTAPTTIQAVTSLLKIMEPEGIIVLVIYHGHPGGDIERDELIKFVTELPQDTAHVLEYRFMNQKNNPPFIIAIEKR
ncbi:methyltransferase domain-containing protein [Pradoshia sp. D12]|uniref:class I SAM-dependent methyltransferase n=1 Tax=Bacillaceae TaxID=186817 RepID=UPI00080ADA93|nr:MULTISPECIES: class I SAM-dependent methyltransferase [Bacillaceae]OCA81896.1 16S rRNA (cytosine(1402)-N(4))-methyltransferase [Bacillus sp. FJAT-27986]QFK72572.1 methyltransferase domain-containing protein [Pradoshia sp. D12]TPF70684.1 methyltransferase domain-containing protein [Bacillus sp. D12]